MGELSLQDNTKPASYTTSSAAGWWNNGPRQELSALCITIVPNCLMDHRSVYGPPCVHYPLAHHKVTSHINLWFTIGNVNLSQHSQSCQDKIITSIIWNLFSPLHPRTHTVLPCNLSVLISFFSHHNLSSCHGFSHLPYCVGGTSIGNLYIYQNLFPPTSHTKWRLEVGLGYVRLCLSSHTVSYYAYSM